ncbi:hypothetical protein IDG51_03935, partial [Pelagibacterales bacterium SAG-MED14]|nr:hypothetical protein [Pelagibacterales bacterium SAG-MED14]
LTATLSGATDQNVTVVLGTSGTSTEGTDYTDGSGNVDDITITAGSTTGTVSFTPADDSIYEGNETATIAISSVTGEASESGTQAVTITITENESAPTVTLTTSATSIAENAGSSLTLTATLSGATNADVTVALSTSGAATEGTDYTDGSGNIDDIVISAGSTTGTVSFTPSDDSVYEDDEAATIAISSVSGGSATESGTQTVTITITDNESAGSVTLAVSASSIAENAGSSLTLTATLSSVSDEDVTVSLSTSGTATEGTDYTDGSGNIDDITISAGDTTGTVNFTPTDDSTYEGNETATIAISGVSGADATESGSQSVSVTITENESAPTVTLTVSATSIAENAGSSITVTATLSGATDENVTVAISTSGTATEGTDYTDGSGVVDDITISAGSTTGTVNFTPTDDSVYEGNETAILSISSVSGGSATESGSQSKTITITDNESAPTVTLATSATSIAENAGTSLTLTATLSVATTADVTVALSTSGTATEGTDYTDGSGNVDDIVISAGSTTGTVSFTPTDDSIYDATSNETATIAVSGVSGGSATESGDQSVTITITDNESAPTVTLSRSAAAIDENSSSTVTITATLSNGTYQDVTVSIDGTGGTGTEGTDFGTVSDITISAGSTTGTAAVDPTDDSIYEGDETAGISISGVSGGSATESGSQSVTVTITENESAPTVTLTSSASSINENAGSSLTLTATLSGAVDETVTVTIGTAGTSTEGTDYTDGSGAVDDITISAGSTTGTVNFTPTDDSIYEGDETAIISIDGVSGGGASESGTQAVTLTISENESAPTVTLAVSATTIAENAGSSLTLTATLSGATDSAITVALDTSGTATEGTDYTDGSGNIDDITISAGSTSGTVNFTPTDDSIYDAASNETATISINGVSGKTGVAENSTPQAVTITITDNESASTVTLTTSATSIAENAGSSLTLTATIGTATFQDVTVSIDGTGGTGTEGTDFGTVSDITISAGATTGTTSFTPTDDSIYDATSNETAGISVSAVSGGGASENGTQAVTITITDNESAPTLTLGTSASSIAENAGSSITLTATLSNGTYQDVTAALGTSGTATEGTDYTDGSGNIDDITISAGATTGTVSFTPTNDSIVEGNETATIAVTGVSGGSATESGTQSETITITDDDSGSFSVADVTVAEGAGTATVTVSVSNAYSSDVTIDYATSNGTATAGSDYTAKNGTLTFSAGDTSKTFAVSITDDSTDESDETITITISNASDGTISDATGTVTITDNDTPSLSINDVSTTNENNTATNMTVTLSDASTKTVTVNYATSNGTATAGSDYTTTSGTLTFSAGETSKTIPVTVLADSTDENNETVTMTLSSASNATISDSTGTFTITDDDNAPSLSINDVSTSDESNAATNMTVTLSAASAKSVTVDYATSNGTATASSDYTATSGTLTFSAGETTKTIGITVLTDSLDEANETVTMTLSSASNASISDSTGTFTITDDDATPSLSINDVTASNENNAATNMTVTLSAAAGRDVTVAYATSNGTATAGSDYTATNGTLTISAGDTTGTIGVTVLTDSLDEANETVTMTLSSATNATISDSTGTFTITDDDATPSLSINDVTASNENNAATNMTVTLSAAAGRDVTVAYATSNGTATAGSDYTATSGTLTISAGDTTGTIGVTVLADTLDEANETATMTLSSATNATISDATGTFTITDDDSTPSLSINDVSTTNESNTATNMTVTLSAAAGRDVTVDYATSNGTATAGSDYTATNGTLTISAGDTTGTIPITVLADSAAEANETVTMTLSSASNATISDSTGTFTITDDDTPSLSINDVSTSDESNAATNMTVTLSNASTQTVTVNYATSNGTATAGSDYTATNGTLTFTAGQTSKTIAVTVLSDSLDEADETVTMTLSSASNATISDATGTFTITDDDATPSLSINDVSTTNESSTSTNLTVTLSAASAQDVTVDFTTAWPGGLPTTADAGLDYTATNGTLTISAGDTTGTIPVTVIQDNIFEEDEILYINLSNPINATISDARGVLTITDDESRPTATLTVDATSIDENSGSSLTLTATLTGATKDTNSVYLDTSGTATEATDYTDGNGVINNIIISAGSTTGTVNFTPTDDSIYEGDETAIISINTVAGKAVENSTPQEVTITITENESAPTVSLSSSASSITENSGSNITLTATLSGATDSAITVALGTSGTATEGTDYSDDGGTSSLDDITISAGATTGTVTFNPTTDTVCEINNETATISITGVSGKTGVAENSTPQAETITITEPDEFVCGTQLSYSSTNANTEAATTEFDKINASSGCYPGNVTCGSWVGLSVQNPLEVTNIHKAKGGYGLTGDGQVVGVMDNNFNTSHDDFDGSDRTVTAVGTITSANSSNYHGAAVSGILAADNDGAGVVGVADKADLRLCEIPATISALASATGFNTLTTCVNDLTSNSAVVVNQSFGLNWFNADDLDAYISTFPGNTVTELFQYGLTDYLDYNNTDDSWMDVDGSLNATMQTAITNYITALNNFQANGVVVQSNSNITTEVDADIFAALPKYFTQLAEAWIAVINIEVDGASGSESYSLQSAPCGQTKTYCLGADGTQLTGVANGTGSDTHLIGSGTSYAAPQVSGAVALLAEAFPNHTPEMLVDRLLATGQNSTSLIGAHEGAVTFGNGVQHGYNANYGHGLMDVYAALNPITSSSYSQSIYTSGGNPFGDPLSNSQSGGQSLALTTLSVSQSFGDSISTALSDEINYFYDALNGGFAYKMDGHVIPQSNTKPVISLESEMNGMKSASTLNNYLNIGKTDYKNILYKKSFSDDEDLEKQLAVTLGYSALPVQSFFNFEQMALNGITEYNLPFLDQQDQGLSLNTLIEGERFKFSLSSTTPFKQTGGESGDVYMGSSTSLMSTMEYTFNEDLILGLLSGFVEEREGFLGLEGNEAFSLDNSSNLSKFNSLKIQKNIKDDLALTITGTLAYSDFEGDKNSLLKSADNILSESYSLSLSKANLFGNDNFSISISQPNRVRDGSLTLRLSDLADQDGNINIRETAVDLEPSGRQIDTSFAYTKDISEDFTLSLKATITDEYNHIKDNDKHYSGYIGLNFENLKIGVSDATNISRPSVQLKYRKEF